MVSSPRHRCCPVEIHCPMTVDSTKFITAATTGYCVRPFRTCLCDIYGPVRSVRTPVITAMKIRNAKS